MMALLSVALPALGIAAAAAGLAGPYLRGLYLPFDMLSHFRLHFLGALIACALALAVGRHQRAVMAIGLAATVVTIGLQGRVSALLPGPAAPAGDGERVLRVLAFNTWQGNRDWRRVADTLRGDDPDIAILIEFAENMRPLLDALKDRYPYRATCLEGVACDIGLFSKQRILHWQAFGASPGPKAIVAKLAGITVVGTHLIRPPAVHVQMRQIESLARRVIGLNGPLVVAGDFNATPWSLHLATFERMTGLTRLTGKPSWPSLGIGLPQIPIDHIFVSDGVRPLGGEAMLRSSGSDHLPVRVTLAVRQR